MKHKRVLVRVDFNVPLQNKKILDDTRIKMALLTIKHLIKQESIVVLMSHLGGRGSSLRPVASRLEKLLGQKVNFITDCIGGKVKKVINTAKAGDVVLLENLRFYEEEKKNSKMFAKNLARLGDIYVNEAFSVSHREHASISAITGFLPSFSGFLLKEEIKKLSQLRRKPKKPYVVLLGGAKLSTKIKLIKGLTGSASKILIGGAMANVFLEAKGYEIGKSLMEKKMLTEAKKLVKNKEINKKILLPIDVVVAKSVNNNSKAKVRLISEVEKNDIILDIGPKTILKYAEILKKAKTILWNGPMGKFELKHFESGSLILARVIAIQSSSKAFGVCGGGETIEVLNKTKMKEFVDWVSTGGGAMLSFLSKEKMPALNKLKK
ncbi:phosphoglycerate kinase [Candidatus Falkowbacteria bacterium]|nr:phosphoglycerate kinase [Candidatus Falkowbacteria bacterium]MBT4433078.1 phosphoglycerate kinase [Candidatus Falkowbacteria bacterium]